MEVTFRSYITHLSLFLTYDTILYVFVYGTYYVFPFLP